jgi:ribosomal protein L29
VSLLDTATDGLVGALITGVPAWILLRRGRPSREQYEDAWRKQVDELKRELVGERTKTDEQYEQRIEELKAELRRLRRTPRSTGDSADDGS